MSSKYDYIPLERRDRYGPFRLMAIAEGYVMFRRKGGKPYVATIDEWIEMGAADAKVTPLHPVA